MYKQIRQYILIKYKQKNTCMYCNEKKKPNNQYIEVHIDICISTNHLR